MNDVVNANHYLNQVKDVNSLRLPDKICLIATKGLIKFREGNVNQGRMYYLDSIEEARKHSYNRLYILAFSNYVREEIRSKIPIAQQQILKSKLKDISKNNTDSDITAIVKKII